MFEKLYPSESCPECGNSLNVKTQCNPADDGDIEVWFNDGDVVNCDECDFTSTISISDDGEAWVQDI